MNPIDLLSLAVSLSLPMDGANFTGDYALDINPTFGMGLDALPGRASAMTLPGMVLYNNRSDVQGGAQHLPSNPELLHHELEHVAQQGALGPAFWLSYAATGGRAFEPYDPLAEQFGVAASYGSDHDFSNVWTPDDDMRRNYPLFRLSKEDGTSRIQLLPGYPGVNFDVR